MGTDAQYPLCSCSAVAYKIEQAVDMLRSLALRLSLCDVSSNMLKNNCASVDARWLLTFEYL